MSTAQFKRVRAVIETIDLMTTFSLKFGYPLCNVETSPQAAVAVGGAITTDTVRSGTLTDVSADIDGGVEPRLPLWQPGHLPNSGVSGRVAG